MCSSLPPQIKERPSPAPAGLLPLGEASPRIRYSKQFDDGEVEAAMRSSRLSRRTT